MFTHYPIINDLFCFGTPQAYLAQYLSSGRYCYIFVGKLIFISNGQKAILSFYR